MAHRFGQMKSVFEVVRGCHARQIECDPIQERVGEVELLLLLETVRAAVDVDGIQGAQGKTRLEQRHVVLHGVVRTDSRLLCQGLVTDRRLHGLRQLNEQFLEVRFLLAEHYCIADQPTQVRRHGLSRAFTLRAGLGDGRGETAHSEVGPQRIEAALPAPTGLLAHLLEFVEAHGQQLEFAA
jgi:hypothetical protein